MTPSTNNIYLPASSPPWAQPLSRELLGLSIEGDRFEDWSGPLGHPNAFTHQVLKNLWDRTGVTCPTRLGADSQDKYKITKGVKTARVVLAHEPSEGTPYPKPAMAGVHICPDYFALAQNLPAGTKLTIGLNLRRQGEEETLAQAKLLDTFHGSRKAEMSDVELELVAIGNEASSLHFSVPPPNAPPPTARPLRSPLFHRIGPPGWSPFAYIAQTAHLAPLIAKIFNDNIKFQIGISPGSSRIGRNGHFYFGDLNVTSGSLMNKSFIRQMIRHWSEYRPLVEAAGLEFRIGETNSLARGGVSGISNAVEAAIWLVDYALHAATLGIKRLHFHHRIGQSYNWFDPILITGISGGTSADARDAPSLHAPNYSALVVAEAISSSPNRTIVEIASIIPHISAFGIYESGKLVRPVFVNSQVYMDASSTRERTTIELTGVDTRGAMIRRMCAPLTSTSGLTWAGQGYETSDAVATGKLEETRLE